MIINNNKNKYTNENDRNNRFLINKTDINLAINENKKSINNNFKGDNRNYNRSSDSEIKKNSSIYDKIDMNKININKNNSI